MDDDKALIKKLGGPAELARTLGYGARGLQRVHNWLERGIPAKVKLERPDLFLAGDKLPQPPKRRKERATAADVQRETARRLRAALRSDHPRG